MQTATLHAGAAGAIQNLIAEVSAYEADNGIMLEFRIAQHVGTEVDLSRMLDGALRHDWNLRVSDTAAVPDDPVLIRRVNHALHGWQCILMPTLLCVPGASVGCPAARQLQLVARTPHWKHGLCRHLECDSTWHNVTRGRSARSDAGRTRMAPSSRTP